ncbi:MAG: MBOAT family protein [Acidobacteria bacterium]|nr:MAG: MBOAT family protein [Acidobacteriota bacterium]
MLFNSFAFALFLPAVYVLYWSLQGRPLRLQNLLLLVASYVFYGWWDWRFLGLIVLSSATDYLVGLGLAHGDGPRRRRLLLGLSLAVNLGMLGYFKYEGFFVDSLVAALGAAGIELDVRPLRIVLPVGISFYTFQTLSYTFDVYRRRIEPTRDALAFFAYVSFFPQLVAGPIERARHLLPQFLRPRSFDLERAKDGLRQMLWGLFKKIVIADNLAPLVDEIFRTHPQQTAPALLLGAFYFTVQIYCDFSGYSDVAIGSARLFGFDLMRNFAYPFFSRDVGEFWNRWHVSLSSWFRDYFYIPLGGNRVARPRYLLNVLLTFVVSGFWHGANWTFVVWGLLHGLYFLPLAIAGGRRRYPAVVAAGRWLPRPREALQMASTFALVTLAFIVFRSASLADAVAYVHRLLTASWAAPTFHVGLPYAALLFAVEWLQRDKQHGLDVAGLPRRGRWAIYYALVLIMAFYANTGSVPFIYFQF